MNTVNGGCNGEDTNKNTRTIRQIIEIIAEENKYNMIKDVVNYLRPDDKAIIFCSNKARACDLSTDLHIDLRFETLCIQSSRVQVDCEQKLTDFNSGKERILIATDIALRGLDVADITHVVNYDFPHNIDEYIHRVRRAGNFGTCISFVTPEDWALSAALINTLKEAEQEIPEKLYDMARRFIKWKERRRAGAARNNSVSERRVSNQRL